MIQMTKVRKKPVEVYAVQWDGTQAHGTEIAEHINSDLDNDKRNAYLDRVARSASRYNRSYDFYILIETLEGVMTASPGDWIIRGVDGEYYPCKPGIFEKTYEPVVDPTADRTGAAS